MVIGTKGSCSSLSQFTLSTSREQASQNYLFIMFYLFVNSCIICCTKDIN